MNDTKLPTFAEMANDMGAARKMFYYTSEVAAILGVSQNTVLNEIRAGRLQYMLPEGRRSGMLIAPAWVDEWIREGTRNAGDAR